MVTVEYSRDTGACGHSYLVKYTGETEFPLNKYKQPEPYACPVCDERTSYGERPPLVAMVWNGAAKR